MKSAIEVEKIIEEKYYTKIQKIINEYLKENKNLFCFKDYYCDSIWIDVELIQQNWEIIAFSCKECEDELILKMLMKVSIKGTSIIESSNHPILSKRRRKGMMTGSVISARKSSSLLSCLMIHDSTARRIIAVSIIPRAAPAVIFSI